MISLIRRIKRLFSPYSSTLLYHDKLGTIVSIGADHCIKANKNEFELYIRVGKHLVLVKRISKFVFKFAYFHLVILKGAVLYNVSNSKIFMEDWIE